MASELLKSSRKNTATVVALSGDLGGGKTTFTKALAKELGVLETVLSPTFVIMKTYPIRNDGRKARPTSNGTSTLPRTAERSSLRGRQPATYHLRKLVHVDAYRLESASELEAIGWNEILAEPDNLVVIEWPERVKKIVPKDAREIKFKFIDDKTREVAFKKLIF